MGRDAKSAVHGVVGEIRMTWIVEVDGVAWTYESWHEAHEAIWLDLMINERTDDNSWIKKLGECVDGEPFEVGGFKVYKGE